MVNTVVTMQQPHTLNLLLQLQLVLLQLEYTDFVMIMELLEVLFLPTQMQALKYLLVVIVRLQLVFIEQVILLLLCTNMMVSYMLNLGQQGRNKACYCQQVLSLIHI